MSKVATAIVLFAVGATAIVVLGQERLPPDEDADYEYESVGNDLFPGFEKAALIVDYYYSTGVSLGDRFEYEILVTDRTLWLAFSSPGTESYGKVSFETKRALTAPQSRALSRVIDKARLSQVREGVPRPRYSGHTREVLIVRSKNSKIAGGMCNANIFENSRSQREIEAEIAAQRSESSSLAGDYDAVIEALRALFPELKGFISQAERGS